IRNAKEAMPNGGALSIHGTPTADGVEVAVTDTGVGIAPRGYPPDHGTAVLDQSARPRSWACYREVHPGEKQGKYAAYQRNRLGVIPIEKREPISIVRTEPLDLSADRTMGPRAH